MTATHPRIEIFASGQHKAVDGKAWAFDGAALDQIVQSYDYAANPAPVVVGHPTLDAPAYGWVKGVAREGDKIVADLDQVEPAFAEAVKAGRYKRVSASFYPPDHAGNPTPGSWHLKHVGFLGAAAPAVRGVRPVAFAAEQEGCAEFAFINSLDCLGNPSLSEDHDMADKKEGSADFAAAEAKLQADRAALEAEQAKLQADRDALAADRAAARQADAAAFAESLVKAGKLAPAGKSLVAGLLGTLEAAATVSFGEAGDLAPAAAFKKLFDSATPLISFGEQAKDDGAGKAPWKGSNFQGNSSVTDAAALAEAAASFAAEQAAKGITITADAAVRHVLAKGN